MKYFRSEAFFAGGHTVPSRYVLGNVQSEDAFIYDNKKRTSVTDSFIYTIICEDILMRCAANSIFDCAGVWAGGFAEPSRYGVVCHFLQFIFAVI